MEKEVAISPDDHPGEHQEDLRKATTVDTLHNDEATKILARHGSHETWTPDEEKKLRRKIDRKLLTILWKFFAQITASSIANRFSGITYGLQYYDKAMLGQAAIFGLVEDLELKVGIRYSFASAIFYLGFICGAYPAILAAQRYPIEKVAATIVCIWGAVMMSTAGVKTFHGLYAQRFFLGFIESGVSPMFMLVVGGWYKKQEQALRMGAWYCCTGYVSIVSPLINYGLGHITTGSLHPWQYMYLVAGGLTVCWSVAIFFLLPPDPIRAKGFTERERYIAVARMRTNNAGVRNTHFKKAHVIEALTDVKFWLVFSTAFTMFIANGPVSSFIPIIIKSFGFSELTSLLLIMPAGFMSGTTELLIPFFASRTTKYRTWLVVGCECGTILASLLLWFVPITVGHQGILLFACYILPSFGGAYAVLMGLQIANTAGYTKRSFTSSGIFVGYCLGNFTGPLLFREKDAPKYIPGWRATFGTTVAALTLAIIYRFYCLWENKRRDRGGVMEAFDHAFEDDLTDKKVQSYDSVVL